MTSSGPFSIASRSPEETAAIAAALAPHLRAGDVVLLDGDLAAGKTHFVTALAAALEAHDAVTSPTFAIAQFYAAPHASLLHMDVYRLDDIAAFRDLALDEHFETAITLIEWGGRFAAAFPDHLHIAITVADELRTLTVSAQGPRWAPVLATLRTGPGAQC
ncbi:MAG: tRNA (adenosine(37)-N6)-threonylcarbamoyltransferase complex ATPase subunit type 1 TsaE [Hyphomonadaceae bacterium]|nr:tRNA (adenosine(37)-N6)-threonylcarbamoyltransferase complex ATPase subunit type 1 TsaE [Hyphomonadaceae bacterium]